MKHYNLGCMLLTAAMFAAPACGPNGQGNIDGTGAAATDRANQVTNDTGSPDERPAAQDRDRQPAGTTGSIASQPEEANGAGPDAVITMKIQAKYADDDVVKGRNIDVDTDGGVVTLRGSVDSLRERDAAEQLARETAGVKRVINELKVATR